MMGIFSFRAVAAAARAGLRVAEQQDNCDEDADNAQDDGENSHDRRGLLSGAGSLHCFT